MSWHGMGSEPSGVARVVVSLAVAGAGVLKLWHLEVAGDWDVSKTVLGSGRTVWIVSSIEVLLGALMWTRLARGAALAVMMFAAFGPLALATLDAGSGSAACGCLGRVAITKAEYAGFCCALFMVALIASRPPSTREAADRSRGP